MPRSTTDCQDQEYETKNTDFETKNETAIVGLEAGLETKITVSRPHPWWSEAGSRIHRQVTTGSFVSA